MPEFSGVVIEMCLGFPSAPWNIERMGQGPSAWLEPESPAKLPPNAVLSKAKD